MRHDHKWPRMRARNRATKSVWRAVLLLILVVAGGLLAERFLPDEAPAPTVTPAPAKGSSAISGVHFGFCHTGGGTNCVVDGDTFWMAGTKIRIADIDAPETHPSRCAVEADLGARATARLRALLNAGPVTLASADRDADKYGRKLRIVLRDGKSLGDTLVAEGLARPWGGQRMPWCA